MTYKILYIDDQDTSSRQKDFEGLGFEVITHKPTNDFKEINSELILEILKTVELNTTGNI